MKIIYALLCLFGLFFLTGCQPPAGEQKSDKPAIAVDLPKDKIEISLKRIDGEGQLNLYDMTADRTILYITASWVDNGSASADQLIQLQEAGYPVIPVIFDERGNDVVLTEMDSRIKDMGAYAGSEALRDQLGVRALPTAVLLSGSGMVEAIWPGFVRADEIIASINTL